MLSTPVAGNASAPDVPSSMSPGFDDTVWAVTHWGSTVYVGGEFTSVTDLHGDSFPRNGAAAFDAATGEVLSWDPDVNGTVYAMNATKRGVLIGGRFSVVGGAKRNNLALVSKGTGAPSTSFKRSTNGKVTTIETGHGRLYIGGSFSRSGGKKRWNTAAFENKAPYRLSGWTPKPVNGGVDDIESTRAGVYISGKFRQFGSNKKWQRLVLVRSGSGKLKTGFKPSDITFEVLDIVVRGDRVYSAVAGGGGGRVYSTNATTGRTVWSHKTNGDAQALDLVDNILYVGGHFGRICDDPRSGRLDNCRSGTWLVRPRAAAIGINTGNIKTWNPSGNSRWGVRAIDFVPKVDVLAVGGHVTAWGSTSARRMAIFGPGV